MRSLVLLVALVAGAMAASSRTTSPRTTTTSTHHPDVEEVEDGETYTPFSGDRFDNFDWRLCKTVERRETGNLVISPLGVKLVLAMLYEGSARVTAREIRNTLELPAKRADVRRIFQDVLKSLKKFGSGSEMDIGTKLYVDKSVKPRQLYADTLKAVYSSCVEQIDFSRPVEAADTINSWVDAVTKGHIQNLVSGDESMASKVMLLVNAIFFKGLWKRQFDPEHTAPGRFHTTPGRSVTASYMHLTDKFYIYEAEDLRAKILRLPYEGKKFSMFVVLPDSPTGLNALLNKLTPDTLRRYMWNMTENNVEVLLPKFSFTYTVDMTQALREMGINDIFENTASLKGMVEEGRAPAGFKVSEVLQKAGLEVGEKGTTAYAATVVSIDNKFGEEEYSFNASHPFMFYIEDETTGTVIFVGKVVDPSKMEAVTGPFAPIPSVGPDNTLSTRRPSNRPTTRAPPRRPFEDSDQRRPGTPTRTRITPVAAADTNITRLWADLFTQDRT